jgi:capsid portal protein
MATENETVVLDTENDPIAKALAEAIRNSFIDPSSSDPVVDEAFIVGDDDTIISASELLNKAAQEGTKWFGERRSVSQKDAIRQDESDIDDAQRAVPGSSREVISKTAIGTTQQSAELGQAKFAGDLSKIQIVEPPYPPDLLSVFLEVDETHFRCVRTKVTDSVGRDFELVPTVTVVPDEVKKKKGPDTKEVSGKDDIPPSPLQPIGPDSAYIDPASSRQLLESGQMIGQDINAPNVGGFKSFMQKSVETPREDIFSPESRSRVVKQSIVDDATQDVEDFIRDANDVIGFEGVLDRTAMDYEAVGWGAIEVIRSIDMKVRRITHIPATRVRVLKGWRGFVELINYDRADGTRVQSGRFIYYQPFGSKVVSKKRKHPVTGTPLPYDPELDGELAPANCEWQLTDRFTGLPTSDLTRAANEIIWIPRHHANSIYYGYTDVVPALGWLLSNVHIRDYLLQFFEHNTVPRYAVIIEGAKLAEPVKKLISQYFSTHIKGKAHKTLIIPVPSMRGEVKIRFEKLDADSKEGSFQETKKNNAQAIMCAHGVSPAIIGISEHSELGSGKGLSQAEIYKDRIVSPSQRYWAMKINNLFRFGLGVLLVNIKFSPLDIRDKKSEMEVHTGYLFKGCKTINQIRKEAGIGDPIPGGDRAFIVLGQTVIFVDELTEAVGTEKQDLMDQVDDLQTQMAIKATNAAAAAKKGVGNEPGTSSKTKSSKKLPKSGSGGGKSSKK